MNPLQNESNGQAAGACESLNVKHEPKDSDKQPQPWTAPDFVERSVLAEIGAYSFAER